MRQILRASGLEAAYGFWICERLDHPEERVMELNSSDPCPEDLDPLHLVVLIAKAEPLAAERLPLFGIADGAYHQHADHPGLMTKREVRIQLLAELDLPAAGVLWDLGAGTGSVAIFGLPALRLQPGLQLYAVERRSGAVPLIQANAERLAVGQPAAVLQGMPAACWLSCLIPIGCCWAVVAQPELSCWRRCCRVCAPAVGGDSLWPPWKRWVSCARCWRPMGCR